MLSDEKLKKIYIDAYYKASNEAGLVGAGLVAIRAVAEAAVQAEREGAEAVAYIHRHGNHYEVAERFLNDDEKSRGWTEEPLYTHPPQASATVPEGYALVPIEPTESMLESARLATESEGLTTTTWLRNCVYRAMLAAAPSRPGDEKVAR